MVKGKGDNLPDLPAMPFGTAGDGAARERQQRHLLRRPSSTHRQEERRREVQGEVHRDLRCRCVGRAEPPQPRGAGRPRVSVADARATAGPTGGRLRFARHAPSRRGPVRRSMCRGMKRDIFTAEHELFREQFRRFAEKEIAPKVGAVERARHERPRDLAALRRGGLPRRQPAGRVRRRRRRLPLRRDHHGGARRRARARADAVAALRHHPALPHRPTAARSRSGATCPARSAARSCSASP